MDRRRVQRWFRLACALFTIATGVVRADLSGAGNAPSYTAASIVNAATQTTQALAPNAIATIYGTNLSWDTHAITSADLTGGSLPSTVDGVTVFVGGLAANIFYVSPTQINFLIPYELTAGVTRIFVGRDGIMGPTITVQLDNASPGFFQWNGNLAIAQHADGTLISPSAPAVAGEIIVLYANGLGHTSPNTQSGRLVQSAAEITDLSQLQVLLDGNPCPAASVLYAGLTPYFAGLYQINLKLPDTLPPNPIIQIAVGNDISPNTVQLPTQPQ